MDTEEFKSTFVDVDLDAILTEADNPSVNSEEEYIKYKNSYMNSAISALEQYSDACKNIQTLESAQMTVNGGKIMYQYIDEDVLNGFKQVKNELITKQRVELKNILTFCDKLNKSMTFNKTLNRSPSIRSVRSIVSSSSNKGGLFSKFRIRRK
jgi:hypothetical protein